MHCAVECSQRATIERKFIHFWEISVQHLSMYFIYDVSLSIIIIIIIIIIVYYAQGSKNKKYMPDLCREGYYEKMDGVCLTDR